MMSKRHILTAIFAAVGMGTLILDSKTALIGAKEGIEICVRTVIPSLFPFILFSTLLTGSLIGHRIPLLSFLGKLCRIPAGAESVLAAGILGGYPVGAQCIYQAYKSGNLEKKDAHRLLGFCSNAGPAFIFGMCGTLFSSPGKAWFLWGIHILSALFVGVFLPGRARYSEQIQPSKPVTLANALSKTVPICANICGWVIMFRIVIAFFDRWFLWLLPSTVQTSVIGFLELANGCCMLANLDAEPTRFILCSAFLGFGGICVSMQTVSVTAELGTGWYFPGKIMQCGISIILAALTAPLLFSAELTSFSVSKALIFSIPAMGTCLLIAFNLKKDVAFQQDLIYNKKKIPKRVTVCCLEKKSKNPAHIAPTVQK